MPVTPQEIRNKPTIFEALKGKSVVEVIEIVIYTAFKGLTGHEVTLFRWGGKAKPQSSGSQQGPPQG